MRSRLVKLALVVLVLVSLFGLGGWYHLEHPPTSDQVMQRLFGKAPPSLRSEQIVNYSIYGHAREVSKLPTAVTRFGATWGHGVLYVPDAETDPKDVWVTKNGHVWEYKFATRTGLPT
ncbi:MAG: hypothetical protein JWP74_579 [Marmoricola sp.]|nr:hypothetical protein [Marmoricola sp.]